MENWKLSSEKIISQGDRMDDDIVENILKIHGHKDIIQNQRIQYHKALLQCESDLKEALNFIEMIPRAPIVNSADEEFKNQAEQFLLKYLP